MPALIHIFYFYYLFLSFDLAYILYADADNITHPTSCPGPPCYDPETREK